MEQDNCKLYKHVFFPATEEAENRVKSQGGRFVYYTTAETAIKIIQSRKVWLRTTQVMNDFTEVAHGIDCLKGVYKSPLGEKLNAVLDSYHHGLSEEVKALFDSWMTNILTGTFVVSVSEHRPDEYKYGRLSMWRAYGGVSGVALVLNGGAMFRPSDALGVYTYPVNYWDCIGLTKTLEVVAQRLLDNPEFVQSLGKENLKQAFLDVLRISAICTKHPAFGEEREWRVVATPSMYPVKHLIQDVEVVGSIPQIVLKLGLEDRPGDGLYGLNPDEFVDRVLIGPCEYPLTIRDALVSVLHDAGVPAPEDRIVVTGIPLRDNQR